MTQRVSIPAKCVACGRTVVMEMFSPQIINTYTVTTIIVEHPFTAECPCGEELIPQVGEVPGISIAGVPTGKQKLVKPATVMPPLIKN